jgi:hypothetical protein
MSKSVRKGMSATGLARVTWRKSTHSGQLGNCVEAAWHQARPVGTPTMCAPNAALACNTASPTTEPIHRVCVVTRGDWRLVLTT